MDKEHEIIGKIMQERAALLEKELEKVRSFYIAEGRDFKDFTLIVHGGGSPAGNS